MQMPIGPLHCPVQFICFLQHVEQHDQHIGAVSCVPFGSGYNKECVDVCAVQVQVQGLALQWEEVGGCEVGPIFFSVAFPAPLILLLAD